MGVEPTADAYAAPATGFEDRGAHRDTSTPMLRGWGNVSRAGGFRQMMAIC